MVGIVVAVEPSLKFALGHDAHSWHGKCKTERRAPPDGAKFGELLALLRPASILDLVASALLKFVAFGSLIASPATRITSRVAPLQLTARNGLITAAGS
jgi:hypothetical protein